MKKVIQASSVWLRDVPDAHRGCNGSCQFFIVARVGTKKRLAEILDTNVRALNHFGCDETAPQYRDIPQEDDTIYYRAEHTKSGHLNQWFVWTRPTYFKPLTK